EGLRATRGCVQERLEERCIMRPRGRNHRYSKSLHLGLRLQLGLVACTTALLLMAGAALGAVTASPVRASARMSATKTPTHGKSDGSTRSAGKSHHSKSKKKVKRLGSTARQASVSPINLIQPKVTGTDLVGQTLTTTHGIWANRWGRFTFGWRDCDSTGKSCTVIAGAKSDTYTLTQNDAGETIR